MIFVIIGRDGPDPSRRLAARADHLEFVAGRQQTIIYGGPLIEEGKMVGSLFIMDVPSRADVDEYCAQDPYFTQGVFETVEILESRWMVPEQEPGFLRAEAERLRS
jgi:uncharacterized protein YciI